MASKLTPEGSIALIKANLAEVLNEEIIEKCYPQGETPIKGLLGHSNDWQASLWLATRSIHQEHMITER